MAAKTVAIEQLSMGVLYQLGNWVVAKTCHGRSLWLLTQFYTLKVWIALMAISSSQSGKASKKAIDRNYDCYIALY